jgi:hypothetical protein
VPTKRFPKPHCEESTYQTVDPTTGEENVEAVPRRPKDNDWTNGERVVTSANIVAYPPADVLRHEWHMNAEVCAGSNSVQYLTKYFTKTGSLDSAMIKQKTTEISAAEAKARITGAIAAATKHDSDKAQQSTKPDDVIDEIAAHRDSRVVGAPSAVMALRSYPELYIDPPVQSLAVHLPGEEQVFYASAKKGAMQRAVTKHSEEYTTLTAYFAANEGDISSAGAPAQCIPYATFPLYFSFDKKKGWVPRQRRTKVKLGRVNWVHPSDTERFALRALLQANTGARNFEDLKSVDGTQHETFAAAAVAAGLMESDAGMHTSTLQSHT